MIIRTRRFLRSPLFPIFMIVFVDVLGFAITIPVLPLYVQGEFGATAVQITSLSTVFFSAQLIATPQLGRLSDRVGRRPVLIISQFGSFLALLLSGLAPGLAYLYVARIIDGLTGGNISVAQAYLSDVTDRQNRTSGMGIINVAFNSSLLIGPAFGGLVAARFGPRVPFLLAAALALFTIALSYFLLPEPEKREPKARQTAQTDPLPRGNGRKLTAVLLLPGMFLLLTITLADRVGFMIYQPTWVLWAETLLFSGRDPAFVQQAVGWIMTLIGASGIATQVWLVGPLTRKMGEKRMVFTGTLMRGTAWGLMALLPMVGPTLLAAPLIGIGGAIGLPALTSLVTYVAPPDQQGYAIGLLQASKGIGRIVGSMIGGLVFQLLSPSATLGVAAMISFALLLAIIQLPEESSAKVVCAPTNKTL
ncbi:MAG: MFS transporter [Chloroflexi bacterium]|nr:MFS transporter [Chloroflexota bacterium]